MFEAHVLHLLRKYLGEYVYGLSSEALRISVWKGDVVLKDLKLKAEALNSLRLPVIVKAGFVGKITLKVPWKSLGKEPVIVLIDRVFVLAHPAPDGRTLKEEDREKLFGAKLQQIEEAETATLEAKAASKLGNQPGGSSWLGSLIASIIGNLKISISNVHIRYEDSISNPGHPFSSGVTLAKLAAVTMDEQGNETFDTSGALDKLRKSLQLERLAVYHDSDSPAWKIDKKWEELSPQEWIEIFEDGINEPSCDYGKGSLWALKREYLVSPINGVLKYHRLGNQERKDPEIPFEKASLVLTDVSLSITEAQYHDCLKLLEVVSRYKTHVDVSHLRPMVPVAEDPLQWWRYAVQAELQQKRMCYRFSWDKIRYLCQLRRRYIQLYACSLKRLPEVDKTELREIEKDLDSKVILLWRLLAHAKVESVKSMEQRSQMKKSWFSFTWRTTSNNVSVSNENEESHLEEERLTKEEWQAINKLLSYQPDEELNFHSGKSAHNMIQFLVNVSVGRAAARIISSNQAEIVCGRFEQLDISTKFYHRSTHCDVSLKFYGVSAPEGSLAQSVSSEHRVNALAASFVHSPTGENVDWRLSATIAPCHVTVLMESYDRFIEFVKRSNAVSPTVALETATALQMKIEKVTRRAQEQFQMVLEEQSRFALDIDFDAPKVRVPVKISSTSKCDDHFLLDFGHFTLHTKEGQSDEQRQSLYSRFYISGRDIAACFINHGSDNNDCTAATSDVDEHPSKLQISEDVDHYYSLVDRCGMVVIVDQIKVPHPSYPSTRISVQVPNLFIHFSPARYHKLMELLEILYGTVENNDQIASDSFQTGLALWSPADLASDARILVWRGIGNSVAEWQPSYIILSGIYLYILESETSQTYQRCSSMAGRQIYEVPPTSVGGSQFSVAVGSRGMSVQKVLESSSTLIIEFQDEGQKANWLKGLVQATYRASAPPAVDVLGASSDDVSDLAETRATNFGTADLVINGALLETKLLIYGKCGDQESEKLEETLILELLADGGKVHLIRMGGDLTVKMKLHSLKIKDELQGRLSLSPQYLACSVLNDKSEVASPDTLDTNEKDLDKLFMEEEDIFKDALPEFMSFPDLSFNSHNMDTRYSTNSRSSDVSEHGDYFDSAEALLHDRDPTKVKGGTSEVFYEARENDASDFVAVTFSTRNPGSPFYDGIDTEMSIRMSKLEFYCNRPTLIALIGFGWDLSLVSSAIAVNMPKSESTQSEEKVEESGRAFVKGLLGFGKGRVVFRLSMDVDSVCIFLNKEDGSQLAMLIQESFLLDLKVHPSSLSIDGTLGNFKLRDMSLGMDNCWGWLCDIRNQGTESLIKFTFNSYSSEDDDYEGYDYSLHGRLSGVRIVFLYRFVQEVTMYFMELATPTTEEAIKLVDKVGGLEWLIQKYEIDGASALKLDLSLDTPIIIVPRNSESNDFLQLDLGQLKVINEFSWHGCPDKDPSAIHLDIIHVEILGVNMAVGIDGLIGKSMIREGQGLHICVRRSLRDVFRKVPTFSVEIKVGILHGVMSDKEYSVILDCASMNINEEPKLPPSFRGNLSAPKETIRMLADKVNMNSQIFLSRTVTIVAVEVKYALLELCNGIVEESPLAHVALERLWVSYRMTSLSEADLYLTIPVFSIFDIRPDTRPEMRLMLGSSFDVSKQVYHGNYTDNSASKELDDIEVVDAPNSTMFLMDYRFRESSQSFVVRIQQPRILVVPDFLLAVGEFFVPALGAITGREEALDPKNDPLTKNNSIVLTSPLYQQQEPVVHLSPKRQLIVDGLGVDEYTYDGCGGTICINEEYHPKEIMPSRPQPVIVIGRGKKLRFMNVKIENAALLRKSTYLNNGSSYSVAVEDGVDIRSLDNFTSDKDSMNLEYTLKSSETSISGGAEDLNHTRSITFEAQVVSPEFTFYDSTKLSLDDSLHGEKLLRAKLDLSFMYAAKENDTWIRTLVKDLTVEAGSGIVILDPVDISGGYTSLKDKTNISLISTDICVRLPLSVISLVLDLQNQVMSALQLGNACPLASCTNFNQLWVSPKGNGPGCNLTFWRPQAPSNYVILGDCVTSRPIPPSQAVMAVSNTYGRVRKPLGFKLIGFLSKIQESEEGRGQSDLGGDCSLWIPIPPPGYSSLGCVAHIGSQPPPNHIVYCIRSDLVTATACTECMLCVPPNPRFLSGFTIWRLDNVLGSFYSHPDSESPVRDGGYDLSHILIWSANRHNSVSQNPTSDLTVRHDTGSHPENSNSSSSSGWDILRSISRASSCYMSSPHFERIWWDKGNELRRPVSIWRPIARPGYAVLGDCITEGLEPPALGIIFKCYNPEFSAKPVQFARIAHIERKGVDEAFFWYPIAPPGYASLGCIVSRTDDAPVADSFCCPRMDLVNSANIIETPITRSSSSKGSHCWSIWKVENQACTFLARPDLKKPSSRLAYSIGDSVKPKSRENLSAEMKLRFCSLTILDSLCGTVTPLVDATVTNINLATHGRFESMNAVLISSIAASTFNPQLEAWEPLVEPFDGIFKFETYDTGLCVNSSYGKRVRIAATSPVNLNISAANLDTFAETILSWRKHAELELKSSELCEGASSDLRGRDESMFSALDEDDFQTVIIENKLGCEFYLKRIEQNSESIELLQHDQCASAWMPPPRFSDRLNAAVESREPRCYVAVKIYESRGLPIVDDGNGHNFFCALRLVVDSHATEHHKLFPQSARTKCVKPFISDNIEPAVGTARWNEIFIFEVPRKGQAKLEVEVTNLASKAGKGQVVGSVSISTGQGAVTLKKVASSRVFQSSDVQDSVSYPLRKKTSGHLDTDGSLRDHGSLLISTTYFERKTIAKFQMETKGGNGTGSDVGFCIGFGPEGPWESFRSLLPLSIVPKSLKQNFIALEVVMKNGKKYAILRGLATVVNDSDVKVDLCVCSVSQLHSQTLSISESSRRNVMVEEVFENQRYQPISGWGSKWPGFRGSDTERWTTRDFSYSSKDFFEPPLPPGWRWTSTWTVDKSQFVDTDGWAYGSDYQSIKWPPTSSKSRTKSSVDFARRRRWIRTRQQIVSDTNMDNVFTTLSPGSSAVLPWKSIQRESDLCLQVRPYVESPGSPFPWGRTVSMGSGSPFPWGRTVSMGSGYSIRNDQPFMDHGSLSRQKTMPPENALLNSEFRLNQLEKKDVLSHCNSNSNGKELFWLSIGTDASVLHTELNSPVYDWKISINSPLKLENRLPCPAEFTIWERAIDGNSVERKHSVISSRKSVHIYSADVRRPIYLTLFVQGGWALEKDPVLILDLSSFGHVSSFWMVHRQSKRRLRVSIELDLGSTDAAPKTVRFFVPYWISNDSSLPLSYRMVEVEPSENVEMDSTRAVKSAKVASRSPTYSGHVKNPGARRNIQVLEYIEDSSLNPVMVSPQDYAGRGNALSFPSRNESYLSPRIGISVALRHSEHFSPGISLLELEKERVDVKAFASDGCYYKLSAVLNTTSDRTKVVHFQPHCLFINRVGRSISLQQCDTQLEEWYHPTDPPKPFQWRSTGKNELLQLCLDGYSWSTPFSVGSEGVMCVSLKNDRNFEQMQLRVEVRSGTKNSSYEVLFRLASLSSPYRIENRSAFLPIRFRQVGGNSDSWQYLLPNAAALFLWEDLGRQRLLEFLVNGTDPLKAVKYNIDEVFDHQPSSVNGGPCSALRVTVLKEEKMNVVKISDWMPENELSITIPASTRKLSRIDSYNQLPVSTSECEFDVTVELAELGLSIIDHTPEEILYLSVQNLLVSRTTGLGSGISRFKLRLHSIQVDNQLPLSPIPVLFRPQRVGEQLDNILKLSLTMQSNGSVDLWIYPYIGFHVQTPENSAFLINIHEPIIWRLHEMIQKVNLGRLSNPQTTAVSVDPIIQIGVLNTSEIRLKVSMAMSPTQRPRGMLGFWSSLMTALGNTENMTVKINSRFHEDICMRQSSLITTAFSNVQKDLLSQPLQLLSGVDILGNASSALGHMSKGVAALSMDKKFIQSRQRQENKTVEDIGDVIREGGGALAKGFFRGVTGILTKPLEGAKSSGVEGFVQGVGKGIIGAAAQPMSGVLDLLSKTTEGANAVRMKILSAITSEEQLLRRRLPRVISGDNLIRPYDEYKAQGQVILQLAESGAFFGQVDLFKVRGKFALSDSYEDHFLLPKGKIIIITHRRIILLQLPSNIIGQRKFIPARDPCSIVWDVLWDDFVTMELRHGKKDHPNSAPSQLVLYLQMKSMETKEHTRIIKCNRNSQQAFEIYSSIDQALNIYGPNRSEAIRKVLKPYSPSIDGASEAIPQEGLCSWSPQQVPQSVPLRSTFGSDTA